MGQQVTIAAEQIDAGRLGYAAISLTHFTDTAEPSIAAGSKVEIGGALYRFTADETGTGWGGIGASNNVYILLTPSGASVSWSYTTTAPTWDTAKQGWYTGANRVVAMLYKDASSLYAFKSFMPGTPTADMMIFGKLHRLPTWNTTDRTLVALTAPPAQGAYSAAKTGAGVVGVPSGAKGVRVKVLLNPYPANTLGWSCCVAFSDNNSNTPTRVTAHPSIFCMDRCTTVGSGSSTSVELDIPLNSAGQFYIYSILMDNVTAASSLIEIAAVGFYMGD